MSTTTKLKPRPVRKKPTVKKMTEPKTESKVIITKQQPVTLTKVQSHLSDIQLIDRNALWEDFQNRMKINNYEINQAFVELKEVVNKIKSLN
jgi:hypothetical protein